MTNWINGIITILETISQILTAGIAVTAFSLLLYSLAFNLKDKVARTFAGIMLCLVIVFSSESFGTTSENPLMIDFWLRVQWIGIILLPPTYLYFSDSLLATTGLPSRWRRKWAIRLTYLFSVLLIVLLFSPWFLGKLVIDQPPAPHHERTVLTTLFTIYYVVILLLAWINFIRAYKRTITKTSKRRMLYLTVSAIGPVVGAFPFLLYGSGFAAHQTLFFWLAVCIVTTGLGGMIFIMAYSVAFFGMPWPDRIIKSRLVKWTLRGPVTASLALALMTLVKRGNEAFGTPYSALSPIVMVVTVLTSEYLITLFYPYIEKWLIYGRDEPDFQIMQTLDERIITRTDLKQFIEMILAAVIDLVQADGAYLVEENEDGLAVVEKTSTSALDVSRLTELEKALEENSDQQDLLWAGDDVLIPLRNGSNGSATKTLGYLGISGIGDRFPLDPDDKDALDRLATRAGIALRDRGMIEQVFETLEKLEPQEELIQRLRAAGRYNQKSLLLDEDWTQQKEMTLWVKGALTHYWGGPKLTESPLMKLSIVQKAVDENEGNEINALRSVLKTALEQLKPSGERKFTGEWLLYNILEMKFLEGKKVREIAMKLAVSEADLYRKQKVAIEKVADILVQMEMKTQDTYGV